MNKVILIGNLTRDPETHTTQSGATYCAFTLAVNRRKHADGTQEACRPRDGAGGGDGGAGYGVPPAECLPAGQPRRGGSWASYVKSILPRGARRAWRAVYRCAHTRGRTA